MTVVVVSSDYLGPMEELGNKLSMDIQYYGNFDTLFEVFHLNMATDVMAYIVAQDYIEPEPLKRLLSLARLQTSEVFTPRILLASHTLEPIRNVVRDSKFKSLDIAHLSYELFSLQDIRRLYGTAFLENVDVFKGRKLLFEDIGIYPLPSLTTKYILSGNVRRIFSTIERTSNLDDLLEIDESYNMLKKINPILGDLRAMILYKYFKVPFPYYDRLDSAIAELDAVNKVEYSIIRDFIKEEFNENIYREIRTRVQKVSPE